MLVVIKETVINTYNLNKELQSTSKSEVYVISPDKGKVLKNKITGNIIKGSVCVTSKVRINEYEEKDIILR